MNGISVIICCYNSAERLPLALEYLSKQKVAQNLSWEIIIVNNNSKDDTVVIAQNVWQSFEGNKELRIVNEDRQGLSYAREAGVKAAFYDIIIFCDDDNLLVENYVQYSYELVKKSKDSGFGIWGGKPIAYFDEGTTVPDWFEKEKANYVIGEQGSRTGDISERGYVWGAGMIMLKKIYLNTFNEKFPMLLLDRAGGVLTSGGDAEISLRALIAGYKLYYDEHLSLKHYISKDKLTPEYNAGLVKGFLNAREKLNKYHIFVHYVSGSNSLKRNYYTLIFLVKHILNKLTLRKLTTLDTTALHALFNNKQFNDMDFALMRGLLKVKTQLNLSAE